MLKYLLLTQQFFRKLQSTLKYVWSNKPSHNYFYFQNLITHKAAEWLYVKVYVLWYRVTSHTNWNLSIIHVFTLNFTTFKLKLNLTIHVKCLCHGVIKTSTVILSLKKSQNISVGQISHSVSWCKCQFLITKISQSVSQLLELDKSLKPANPWFSQLIHEPASHSVSEPTD